MTIKRLQPKANSMCGPSGYRGSKALETGARLHNAANVAAEGTIDVQTSKIFWMP